MLESLSHSFIVHYLHGYGSSEPVYDNKAYAFSATYQDGLLKFFAHHVTPPCTCSPGGLPEYWATEIEAYWLLSHRTGLFNGVSAFQNMREKALHDRVEAVKAANSRSRDLGVAKREITAKFIRGECEEDDAEPFEHDTEAIGDIEVLDKISKA